MVTSPVVVARPAVTAAAPVMAVVATDPRLPMIHTPVRAVPPCILDSSSLELPNRDFSQLVN
jgi:hypothetical protein